MWRWRSSPAHCWTTSAGPRSQGERLITRSPPYLPTHYPELSVRPLFGRVIAEGRVDLHTGHLARSFEQLFGAGRSGRPLTEELLRSWHPTSAGRCTQRQLDAVSAHMMDGFALACPDEEAVGRVSEYFGRFFEAIRSVFLSPEELHLDNA